MNEKWISFCSNYEELLTSSTFDQLIEESVRELWCYSDEEIKELRNILISIWQWKRLSATEKSQLISLTSNEEFSRVMVLKIDILKQKSTSNVPYEKLASYSDFLKEIFDKNNFDTSKNIILQKAWIDIASVLDISEMLSQRKRYYNNWCARYPEIAKNLKDKVVIDESWVKITTDKGGLCFAFSFITSNTPKYSFNQKDDAYDFPESCIESLIMLLGGKCFPGGGISTSIEWTEFCQKVLWLKVWGTYWTSEMVDSTGTKWPYTQSNHAYSLYIDSTGVGLTYDTPDSRLLFFPIEES